MNTIFSLLLLSLSPGVTPYEAEYVSAYDADTWTVIVIVPVTYEAVEPLWVDDVDVSVTLTARVLDKLRIADIDTPEIRGKCPSEKVAAKAARDAVRAMAESADLFTIEVDIEAREKWGRLLGDVFIDGVRISKWLIDNGHARAYDGGTRQGWCPGD